MAAVGALAVAAVAGGPLHAQLPAESFVDVPCPPQLQSDAEVSFRCGELKVPEVRDDPASATLSIPVTILTPTGAEPDPVVMLHGGPGSPAHANARARFAAMSRAELSRVLGGRAWILYDQRGVGMSAPALNCPLPRSLLAGTTPAEAAACAAALTAQGRVLHAYNSVTSAHDIESLRRTLGLGRINLLGASYGSRLAFTYARLYPDQVRAIVHDGPYTPAEQEVVDDALGVDAILRGVARRCAAVASCDKRFPDLEARFVAGVARLAVQPVEGVTDAFAIMDLRDMAFGHEIAPLPALMDKVARGDVGFLAKRRRAAAEIDSTKLKIPPQEMQALGQLWSVDCNEEKTFESKGEYHAARGKSPLVDAFLADADSLIDLCAVWPSGRADPIENEPVIVSAPQLILTGEYDASQSGIVGARIVAAMPTARDLIFTDTGHVQIVGPKAECAFEVIGRFFRDLDPGLPAPLCATAPLVKWR